MRWNNRIARTSALIENRGCSSEQSSSPSKPRTASSYISTVIVASSFSPISYSHSNQYERDDCEQSGESKNWRKIIFCYLIHRWVKCNIKLISFYRVNTFRFPEQEKNCIDSEVSDGVLYSVCLEFNPRKTLLDSCGWKIENEGLRWNLRMKCFVRAEITFCKEEDINFLRIWFQTLKNKLFIMVVTVKHLFSC